MGPLGRLVLDLWQRTRIDWGFASDRLAEAFRRERRLRSDERRFAAETLYGMIRHLRRVDEALAAGGLRPGGPAPDRERLLAYLVLEGGLAPEDAARHARAIDWQRVAGIDAELARERDPVRRVARIHSLPDWLAQILVAERGAEVAELLAASLNQRAPMTVRANLLAGDGAALVADLAAEGIAAHRGELATAAVVVDDRTNLFATGAFKRGLFEAQDEGSQLIAELVAPPPRSRVIDYCAGAGGKTLALAAILASRGRVVACDVDPRKLTELRRRARRAAASNIQTITLPPEPDAATPPALASLEGGSERVLVDAPCTGIGALRRNPEARWRLVPADLERMPALQLAITRRALELVKPGGRLVYATCTALRAENEGVIERLLAERSGLELVPPKDVWGSARAAPIVDASGRFLELLPHRHGTDGFFAAVLRRRA
ncbi:MAG TPA: RsmB/NOP family class I SAM-dependent RNA methyltransferase [Kofleriaceae bacterium]|nr:RsmB/NOP family class I SAM-dependent RNA methyltransferase [Kofleriaceae bacterium]